MLTLITLLLVIIIVILLIINHKLYWIRINTGKSDAYKQIEEKTELNERMRMGSVLRDKVKEKKNN